MSKSAILQSIAKHRPVFPPSYEATSMQASPSPAGLKETFILRLKEAGANVLELKEDDPAYIASLYPGVCDFDRKEMREEYSSSCPLEKLAKIEHALFQGNTGVAENGAIWLEDKDFPHRILPFITQHLILKIAVDRIVADMQEAYKQISLDKLGFGVFISGPSKTADIEQSLVYGAHGAKELTV
ncbi:MAG: LUD domain-containing protein, partial [Dysgonamonadaceae bacterium]|nr:LUD domain-containing protein [Dysgonamonadaceae bacterium]